MRIGDLPAHDRPRERLLARGPSHLSDRELLAILLRTGGRGHSALDLAGVLLRDFGGLAGIAAAQPVELARHAGLGPAKAAVLCAAFRVGHLAREPAEVVTPVRGPADIARLATAELHGARRERVIVLVCDRGNRMRRIVPISEGAIDRSLFPVREILNALLRHDGRAFAIAHNHPSGDPTPSAHDIAATRELEAAAETVGLRFLDHVVVGDQGWARVTPSPRTRD